MSPHAYLEDGVYPQNEEGKSPSADRDLNDIDLFSSGEISADKVSTDEDLTSTSPDTSPSAGEAETDFDLDIDLDDMDMGALSTEIDEGMQDIDFDEEDPAKAENIQAGAEKPEGTDPSDDQDVLMAELESSTAEDAEPRTENDGFDDLASVEDSLGDDDESDTKLVLAEAYVDMGDPDNARDLLEEVLQSGTEEQRKKANDLLETLS